MAEQLHLDWFRDKLEISRAIEKTDPQPVLAWQDSLRKNLNFSAQRIALDEVRGWSRDDGGNIVHESGQFFSIEGTRISSGALKEVKFWDQPIYNQSSGGILAMVTRAPENGTIEFLLQARVDPGNIGWLQLCPSIQSSWSNLNRAHGGKAPPLSEIMEKKDGVRTIYSAEHNEEGSRFWRKSNANIIYFLDDETVMTSDLSYFYWASLSQIKALSLIDNVLSPYVRTVIAPL